MLASTLAAGISGHIGRDSHDDSLIGTGQMGFFKKLWRLIKPYWTSEERWVARSLLGLVIALNLGLVYLNVLFNDWYGRFYDALQDKNLPHFWRELGIFTGLAFAYIVVAVYQYYVRQMLYVRWRRWLTQRYLKNWLANRVYYRIELANRATDNPDQRIQDDVGSFASQTLFLGLDAMSNFVTLCSFFLILWNLSGPLSFTVVGIAVTIPGYMLWAAVIYAAVGSGLIQWIGRKLAEPLFRPAALRSRLSFLTGPLARKCRRCRALSWRGRRVVRLLERFERVLDNWLAIMRLNKSLYPFTYFYRQLAIIFPFVVGAPRYFSGLIKLGTLMQIANAFGTGSGRTVLVHQLLSGHCELACQRRSLDEL